MPCAISILAKLTMFLFDGARFLTRAFLYLSVIGTRCEACAIKFLENKRIVACNLLHAIVNAPKGLNNVPCVVWSCNKLHATHEIMNAERVNNVPCVVWSCIKMHATHEIMNAQKGLNNVPCVVWSCIKMHATHRECQKGLNNVPCVVWSCIKMHATSDGARFLTRAFYINRLSAHTL